MQKALLNLHQTEQNCQMGKLNWFKLWTRKKKKKTKSKTVIREGTVTLFSWYSEFDFQYILFSHFSTLLSTVQHTLKTLPWKMVSHTLEQLLKGILLAVSVWKRTPAFHIHLAKCNSTTIPPIKQYKHICHLYTHSYVAGCRNINKEKSSK